jgi:hypothetical protein
MRQKQIGLIATLAILIVFIAVGFFVSRYPVSEVHGQETPASMRVLLERLRARMETDPAFSISIQFVNPPIPGEPTWQVPGPLSETGSSRRFGEIGDDYVCFLEQGQTFNDSVCIAYTNIMMVIFRN